MTLPASGPLSMSAINAEFGRGLNLNAYRGTVWYTDAGASGTFTSSNLGFNQFYSKRPTSPSFSFTISSSQANANLRTLAVNAGWNQSSAVVATVAGGVYIYSTGTGTPGLTINGSWPGGVTLVNNGFIMGMGGAGGYYSTRGGQAGGSAISLGVSCTITNNSYIGGGGGGGVGVNYDDNPGGGGGAGGGAGAPCYFGGFAGGAGGGLGASGGNGASMPYPSYKGASGGGGGGGRIFPGSGGSGGSGAQGGFGGGAGGGGGGTIRLGTGGNGGSAGGAGGQSDSAGGGGGWGASGASANVNPFGGPGAGGRAIQLNGYTATRNGSGTTYGAVS